MISEASRPVSTLQGVRSNVTDNVTDDVGRQAALDLVNQLLAMYEGPMLRSGAVVANFPFFSATMILGSSATSIVVPGQGYVTRQSNSGPVTGVLSRVSLTDLSVLDELSRPGTLGATGISIPDGTALGAWTSSDPPAITLTKDTLLAPLGGGFSQTVTSVSAFAPGTKAVLLTPTLKDTSKPSKAYVSLPRNPSSTTCPAGGKKGQVVIFEDLAAMPSSTVHVKNHATPAYEDMVASPKPGDDRVFAGNACGIDVIPSTGGIQELAITGFGAIRLAAAKVAPSAFRLFALDSAGVVTSWDIDGSVIAGQVTVTQAKDIEATPNGQRLVVLTAETGGKLQLLDTGTLEVKKTYDIGQVGGMGATQVSVTADGTTALVTDPQHQVIQIVRIIDEKIARQVDNLEDVIKTVPDAAFQTGPSQTQNRRDKLIEKIKDAEQLVKDAEAATDQTTANTLFAQAQNKLLNGVLHRIDGTQGGDPSDDWIMTPSSQALLVPLVQGVLDRLDQAIVLPPGPPPMP